MKKIILTIAFIASGLVASAQVGIGNTDPKVSLQVDKSADAAKADGVLVPRVTVAELNTKAATYGADQNGSLVFITDITGFAGKTSNVTATGFHYYNNTTEKWVPLTGAAAVAQPYQNIVGGVETLTASGTISNNSYFVLYNSGNAGSLVAPTPVAGKTFWVRSIGTGTATITGVTPANQAISGSRMRSFVSDGTNWYASNQ